jgi:cobalt-zinc-cadmium efflux system membrane fusion protein
MNNKNLYISLIAIFAALGIGYFLPKPQSQNSAKIEPSISEHSEDESHTESEEKEGFIELTMQDAIAAGIEVGSVQFGTGSEVKILGTVMPSPEAKVLVAAPISGRVSRVYVAIGTHVSKGQTLFEIISGDGALIVAESAAANANANAARSAHSSDQWLYQQGVISRRDLEASLANTQGSQAYANAAKAKISAFGNPSNNGIVRISSPISGTITTMPATIGSFLAQGVLAAEITNTSNTEVVFQVSPEISTRLSIGGNVRIVTSAQTQHSAIIKAIAPASDVNISSTIVRARVAGDSLPIGSTITGNIVTQSGSEVLRPIVPNDALQNIEQQTFVFILKENGFQAIPVMPGRRFNGQVEIIRGLNGNEQVVTKNAFLLKAELAKGETEHGH